MSVQSEKLVVVVLNTIDITTQRGLCIIGNIHVRHTMFSLGFCVF